MNSEAVLQEEAVARLYEFGKVSDAEGYLERTFLGPASIRPQPEPVRCSSRVLCRTSVFFLVCVLFRLIGHLRIMHLDLARVFQAESDVESVLEEHLHIRRHLRIISHRSRVFILFALMLVIASHVASLLSTTRSRADVNMFTASELALCSITVATGLLELFWGATKINKAQATTCLAAKWHVCATIDSFESSEPENPRTRISYPRVPLLYSHATF
ncbi:uncharacterized protein LOC117905852 [Vitis riparia]|uniref:uncharacterized protein LOC117905852 n=1 Tax=Vitis riparia TaxID=96939 RepID=UPI00155ABC63|nr:uncharacterized protein LOC117905852 [Vitis riparia]